MTGLERGFDERTSASPNRLREAATYWNYCGMLALSIEVGVRPHFSTAARILVSWLPYSADSCLLTGSSSMQSELSAAVSVESLMVDRLLLRRLLELLTVLLLRVRDLHSKSDF